jgi:uncharacterized membrane protein
MSNAWSQISPTDLAALAFNTLAFVAYRAYQRRRARRDPGATLQSRQAGLRASWVAELLSSGNGILGVQTLRNAMMGAIFFASNTVFLVIGALTLTLQGHLAHTWNILTLDPGASDPIARTKLLLLLVTLIVAFFCFINAIRLLAHASIGIGTKAADAAHTTAQIDSAWHYQGLGVRCYYFAVPVMLWLFGPLWFVLAGTASIALMHRFDSAPTRE